MITACSSEYANTAPIVGEKIITWFSDMPDRLSTVLAVEPYRGLYPQWFKYVVRLTAPRTDRGWLEMAV